MGTNGRSERDFEHMTGTSRRSRQQEDISGSGEVGRDFANRYGGLFSEKDWKCPTCSNINWARRTECNQCKTSKPGLETSLGTREGRGGGFFERDEIVEYKQSRNAEKDDEWDEFGRKRKKSRNVNYNDRHYVDYYDRKASKEKKSKEEEEYSYEKSKVKSKSREIIEEGKNEDDEEEGDDDDRWAAWDDIIGNDAKEENNNDNNNNNKNNNDFDGRDNVRSHNERSSSSSSSSHYSKEYRSDKYSRRRSSRSRSPPSRSSHHRDHRDHRDKKFVTQRIS